MSLADYYEAVSRILDQTPAPEYAQAWFQSLIAFNRAVGETIRTGYEHGGIMAASTANSDMLAEVTANEAAIQQGQQGCMTFLTSSNTTASRSGRASAVELPRRGRNGNSETIRRCAHAEHARRRAADRPRRFAAGNSAREKASAAGLDGLLVVGRSFYDRPGDLAYLSGHFPPFPTTVFSEGNRGMGHAMLLLPVVGEPVLLTGRAQTPPRSGGGRRWRAAGDLGSGLIDLLKETYLEDANIGLRAMTFPPAAIDRQRLRELARADARSGAEHRRRDARHQESGRTRPAAPGGTLRRCRVDDRQCYDPARAV
ncbi:MAG: hypothetical protein R2855_02750 [Thermomicrobiales bacterium]